MNDYLRKRLNISRLAIKYPWLTVGFWIAVAVAGLLAFSSLKYALFPEVTFPVVIVHGTSHLGNTLATESQLTEKLESKLISLEGVDGVYSSSFPNETVIRVLFPGGDSLAASTEKVESALADISLAPDNALEIIPFNLNESSAISYAITSENLSLREIGKIIHQEIVPSLAKINGVLIVNILGNSSQVSPQKGDSLGKNVASLVRFNQDNALAIQVVKKSNANTLNIVQQVEAKINQLQPQFPDLQIHLAQTEANYIQEANQATIDALILAIILAVLVIFLFLGNFPATFIAALSIPLALLGTFIVMAIANFNLETITLLALALVIGIVVDDAIVDVENIARHIQKGENPRQAAIAGTDEIGFTVTACTLTIVAVFLPVAFMGGTLGEFFQPFGLTVSAAVIISFLVARTLCPVLAIYWLKPQGETVKLNITFFPNLLKLVRHKYLALLNWSLAHRKLVFLLAIISFVAGLLLIPFIPQGFIPQLDRGEFNIIYLTDLPKLPIGWKIKKIEQDRKDISQDSSFDWLGNLAGDPNGFILRRTRRIGEKIEKVVLENPEVDSLFTVVGILDQPNRGKIYVKLKEDRELNTIQIQEKIRQSLPSLKGTKISIEEIKFVDTGDEKPLTIALTSNSLISLQQTADKIYKRLSQIPNLVDVTSSIDAESFAGEADIFTIERKNGWRAAFLSANLAGGEAIGNVTQEVVKIIQPMLPQGVSLELEGDSARAEGILADFRIALSFSVLSILIVLLLLFGRLLEPLAIGLSLPLSIIGAMLALLITRSDFGMISLIGLIFLLGLVDKNALLLIDYANQLRLRGMSRKKAILETGRVRLRPILMTTFSTILGMLPIALGWGAGAELRQPMAVAIIGGLISSSLLSLIFVPVFYTLLEDLWLKIFAPPHRKQS